jgi:hypothetical protein
VQGIGERAGQAGKTSVDPLESGKRVGVNVADYAKPGDKLGLVVKRILSYWLAFR